MHRHLAGHARARCSANAERLGLDVTDRARGRGAAAVRGRELRSGVRPRGAASHPRPGAGVSGVRARAGARRDGPVRRGALALRRPAGERAQARGRARWRRCGAGRSARARRRRRTAARRRRRWRGRGRARLRSRRADARCQRARAWWTCACAARSCSRTGSAGPTARWRRPPHPRRRAVGLAPVRLPRLSAPAGRRSHACWRVRLPPAIFYNLMLTARKPSR